MRDEATSTDFLTQVMITDNLQILWQGHALLGRLDDHLYVNASRPLFNYGVGTHFRHCLDSYQCFLDGLGTGRIDYDRRERDTLVEKDRACAMARIELTVEALEGLSFTDGGIRLQSRQDSPHWADSSPGRELQFLLSHTIHHYALIALMLRLQGFEPGAAFGVAPSTLEYWKEKSECVR